MCCILNTLHPINTLFKLFCSHRVQILQYLTGRKVRTIEIETYKCGLNETRIQCLLFKKKFTFHQDIAFKTPDQVCKHIEIHPDFFKINYQQWVYMLFKILDF